MCVHMCVCVCTCGVREEGGKREKTKGGELWREVRFCSQQADMDVPQGTCLQVTSTSVCDQE